MLSKEDRKNCGLRWSWAHQSDMQLKSTHVCYGECPFQWTLLQTEIRGHSHLFCLAVLSIIQKASWRLLSLPGLGFCMTDFHLLNAVLFKNCYHDANPHFTNSQITDTLWNKQLGSRAPSLLPAGQYSIISSFSETGVSLFSVITRMRPGLQQAYLSASPKATLCKNFTSPVSEATVAEEPAMLVKWKEQADPSACGTPVAWCSGMFCHTRSRIRFCWANIASEGEMIQTLILWQKPSLQEDSFKG